MKQFHQGRAGLTVKEALVALVLISILAALILPPFSGTFPRCGPTRAMSNARQIHQAAYRMVLDGLASQPRSSLWPGDLAVAETDPVTTTGEFVEYMVKHRYLDRDFVVKLFGGPGVPVYPGVGPFDGQYSVYRVFKVTASDEDDAIFLATKNFHYGAALDPKSPFGVKGCVIVRKGGEGISLSAERAMDKSVGVMPGGTSENPGEQEGNTLKD